MTNDKKEIQPSAFAGERLAKRIAGAGLCSRREAETWIAEGRVKVNGKKVLTPAFTRTGDFRYAANYVFATYRIAPEVRSGSAVILVKSGNQSAALTGALRVIGTETSGGRGRAVGR